MDTVPVEPRKSAPQRFDDWVGKMMLIRVVNAKYPLDPNIQNPERWSRYKAMFSFVIEALSERNRKSDHRSHYYDETMQIMSETVAAMMFVEEELAEEQKKIKEISGR